MMDWKEIMAGAIELSKERERLCGKSPECPECQTKQVQIIDVSSQEWKCRHCKTVFYTEY